MNQIWIQCIGWGWDMEAIEIFYSKEVGQVDLCVYFLYVHAHFMEVRRIRRNYSVRPKALAAVYM